MDELLETIKQKTGLPADKAQDVIETVINFVADKLPAPLASQVRGFLDGDDSGDAGGDGDDGGLMDKGKDALGGLGGLLGGKD